MDKQPLLVRQRVDEPVSALYPSTRLMLVALPIAVVFIGSIVLTEGWWLVAAGVVPVLLLTLAVTDRRIDLHDDGLTFVPLLPLRPRQRFRFRDLAPFHRHSSYWYRTAREGAIVRSVIRDGPLFRVGGVWPRDVLELGSGLAPSRGADPMSVDELVELLEARRRAVTGEHRPWA